MITRRTSPISTAARAAVERLEERRLFAVTVTPLNSIAGSSGTTATVDAAPAFNDDTATFVQFVTPLGNYRVQLFDTRKPGTVENFLRYVNSDRYDNLIIHRSDALDGNAANPPDIIQGGGYVFPGFNHVNTFPAVNNEFTNNGVISNTRGTIAMAKTSDPNSATSEWFINMTDNSTALDDTNNSGGFTVFGEVLDQDMAVVDAIAAVPRFAFQSPFTAIPLRNYTQENLAAGTVPTEDNVIKTTASVIPDVLTYTVSSSDPALVAATIDPAGKVALNYGAGVGTATITVQATGLDATTTASTTFEVGVGQLDVQLGGDSGNKSVSFTDADGTISTITVKGAGTATVRFGGSELTQTTNKGRVNVAGTGGATLNLVSIAGSDASTAITINTRGGDGVTTLDVLSADGALKSVNAKQANLTGAVTTVGAVGSINLLSANGAALNLGGSPGDKGVKIVAGNFVDSDIVSGMPIASLRLASATGTDSEADVISAPGIGNALIQGNSSSTITSVGEPEISKLTINGDFTGTVEAHRIASMVVKGNLSGATVNGTHAANEHANAQEANLKQNHAIGKLLVNGNIENAVIDTAGSIGSITAGSLSGSRVFVGLLGQALLPTSLTQMTQEATLNTLNIKGAVASTDIAARFIGKAQIGTINTNNGGAPFGIATDSLSQLNTRLTDGTRVTIKNVNTQSEFNASIGALDLGDLAVTVL